MDTRRRHSWKVSLTLCFLFSTLLPCSLLHDYCVFHKFVPYFPHVYPNHLNLPAFDSTLNCAEKGHNDLLIDSNVLSHLRAYKAGLLRTSGPG